MNAEADDDRTAGDADDLGESARSILDAIPVQSWEVRRRRYGDERWLVRHNEAYEIDAVTDLVWRACTDRVPVGGVARRVAEDMGEHPAAVLERTINALMMLADAGLIRFERND